MTASVHDDEERPSRQLGLGKGAVYPAAAASGLVHPARHLLHPPGRLVRRLGPAPDADVLEVGPGPGWFTRELAAAVPRGRLQLLDVQSEMLATARARADSSRVSATVGDACALPFEDATFDAVVATAVLGETPDPRRAVAEVARVLRPGGRFAVLETRTDPDFVPHARLRELAAAVGLRPVSRYGRLLGYTALFERAARSRGA
jgi:ubiquinone/menaquinone biosynthesis C-methylase UbiE